MNTGQHLGSTDQHHRLYQARYDLLNVLSQLEDWLHGIDPPPFQGLAGEHGPASPHNQTPGRHTRHIIDHFAALDVALDTAAHSGSAPLVDYEQRQRQADLEHQPDIARARIQYFRTRCRHWCLRGDHPLRIRHQTDQGDTLLDSSLSRELVFLSQHSIHHMAVIEILLSGAGLDAPDGFGVNPSTRRYHDRQRQFANAVSAS